MPCVFTGAARSLAGREETQWRSWKAEGGGKPPPYILPSKRKRAGLCPALKLRACGGAVGLYIGKEFLEAHAGSFSELVPYGSLGNGRLLFVRVVGTPALDVSSLDHILL